MQDIESYINTSVDDCRVSMAFVSDLGFLYKLLFRCEEVGHKSRAQVVRRRIRQIERGQK